MLHDGSNYRLYILDKKNTKKLLQCAYDPNFGANGANRYAYKSMDEISITGAPYDTDWNRWSMLHDGTVYRLYFMPLNRRDVLYQFGFNGYTYEYGHKSTPKIDVVGFPTSLGNDKFNVLHDGNILSLISVTKTQITKFIFSILEKIKFITREKGSLFQLIVYEEDRISVISIFDGSNYLIL